MTLGLTNNHSLQGGAAPVSKNVSKKKLVRISHIHLQWSLLAEFVELNIEEHLSEPEFHAESNNSGLIPPN